MTFDAQGAAEAQSQPGTFSFVERLHGRGFPKSEVKVYLDEVNGFERNKLALQAETQKVTKGDGAKPNVEAEARIAELDALIAKSRYIFELHGFPPERYDAIIDEVYEEFPAEYEVTINPYSGARDKQEKPSTLREELLHAKLWAESIRKITNADGQEDTTVLDEGTAARMRDNFPIDGRRKIDVRIQELRLGSAWMDSIQDEGFLATR